MVALVTSQWRPLHKYRLQLFLPANPSILFRKNTHYFPVFMRENGNEGTKPPTTNLDDNP